MTDRNIDPSGAELSGWADPEARLREALQRDDLALVCQPILALAGSVRYPLGEVLVRLREEETALLPPGEFLPVFEHYRMMPQLDRWVLQSLVKHLEAGSRLARLTMNVSWQTLEDEAFPAFFAERMRAAGIPPSSVLFEIDEPDVLHRFERVSRFAAAVKAAGAGVLVDGFGRKSVTFTRLTTLKADFVKVDGSIIRKLDKSEVARTKLAAMLRVGQTLGIAVIGECVEEKEVLERLKGLGADYAQGFGIVQPQPIESLKKA